MMQYRTDKYGNKLSVLGFGCMRFQQKMGRIRMEPAEQQILQAIKQGVNYFDTAYIYPGSEAALGEILEKHGLREKVYIATKLPHYLVKDLDGLEKKFREQLRRLRTDHIDYYLMHLLNDTATWQRLMDMGIAEWIAEKKKNGQIRQVGFSYHGNSDMFCKLVDAYDWDFCQIQYNYLDEHAQAGRKGLMHANAKGLPVIIMEPLRGGKLVDLLPEKAKKTFAAYAVKRTPAQWGLRWLWDQPQVTVVLSGMNSGEMVAENIRTASASRVGMITEEERAVYAKAVAAIRQTTKVGCTGCGYCQPCPKGVDIPGTFAAYNRWYSEGRSGAMWEYVKCTTLRKNSTAASQCIGCGKCEKHCPQSIAIRQELKNAQKALETPLYKICRKVLGWFARF